ncbi:hypothetical protein BKA66DRAFT_460320 [Pyrenochaeta sp. MPI-SDFR-AT-0127]|nr:hypothetical protein BKA66DRAFT_460320 [Pyrenochaeta sp. MPI-SDFR-AT-0127]
MRKAALQKEITDDQAIQRAQYTLDKRFWPIEGYWDGVVFTDEAHMALDDFPQEWILRVIGERFHPKNIVEQEDQSANVVHFAAWINYYDKAPHLTFYNDEYDDVVPVKPLSKPRRRPTTETEEQYIKRLAEWEAQKARILEVKKPGNSMRASYYTEKLLPVYRDAIKDLEIRSDQLRSHVRRRDRYNWYLVEDNDPSHGTKNSSSLPAL